jgi:hypothetical protein
VKQLAAHNVDVYSVVAGARRFVSAQLRATRKPWTKGAIHSWICGGVKPRRGDTSDVCGGDAKNYLT